MVQNEKHLDDFAKENEIKLPTELVTFFKKRSLVIEPHQPNMQISYASIKGSNPQQVPREYFTDDTLMESTEEFEFTNMDESSKELADTLTVDVLKHIFGPQTRYTDIRKSYMIGTSTMPIKIQFNENGKKSRKTLYVKKANSNRIIGKFLYNIISGTQEYKYGITPEAFIEEGISGNVLSHVDEALYLASTEYKNGVVRAAVHSDFLGLDRDVKGPRNRIVDPKHRTILFDFNILLAPKKKLAENYILQAYSGMPGFFNDSTTNSFIEEQHEVVRRVEVHHDAFFKFIRLSGDLTDHTHKSADDRAILYYGAKSLEDYFEKKLSVYRNS